MVYPEPMDAEQQSYYQLLNLVALVVVHEVERHPFRAGWYRGRLQAAIKAHERRYGPLARFN